MAPLRHHGRSQDEQLWLCPRYLLATQTCNKSVQEQKHSTTPASPKPRLPPPKKQAPSHPPILTPSCQKQLVLFCSLSKIVSGLERQSASVQRRCLVHDAHVVAAARADHGAGANECTFCGDRVLRRRESLHAHMVRDLAFSVA